MTYLILNSLSFFRCSRTCIVLSYSFLSPVTHVSLPWLFVAVIALNFLLLWRFLLTASCTRIILRSYCWVVPNTRTIKNVNTWYFHTKASTPIDCLTIYFYRSLVGRLWNKMSDYTSAVFGVRKVKWNVAYNSAFF